MSRFKGVVLNSGCVAENEIRSPSDAACLMALARYPENVLPSLTRKNGTIAVVHAYNRQTAKCAITLKRKIDNETDNTIAVCKVAKV